jgi:hypothetical protein
MANSISFGGGGSPSSGRSVGGASQIITYGMFTYPTGNLDINGGRPVSNGGVSLSQEPSGGATGWGADGSGNVYVNSNGATTYLQGYLNNGYTMYSSNGYSWNGGFQGTFYWSTVPAKMSAPTVTASTTTAGRISVAFSGPDNGGSGITSYSIYVNGAFNKTVYSTPATVDSLTPGGSYTITMSAVNAVGTATQSNGTSVTLINVPNAPGIDDITRVGRNVTVPVQTSSANGGTAITSYTVQYSANDGETWNVNNDAQTISGAVGANVTFSNLAPALTYRFRALATNSIGNSGWTTTASFFLPAGGKRYNTATSQFVATNTAKRYDGATSQWKDINTAKRYSSATSSWVDLG